MKSNRKNLSININYGEKAEAVEVLQKIIKEIRRAKSKYNREACQTAIYEWSIELEAPEPYEEKKINGIYCMIYQSKMNKK